MKLTDISRITTVEDFIRRYNLDSLADNVKIVKKLDEQLTKAYGNIKKYITQMVQLGSTTQYFLSGIPTLESSPFIDWENPNDHIGDLYYDKNTGKTYIFTVEDGIYNWELVDDDTLNSIMALANNDADTNSDNKRSVFVNKPDKYFVGDIWVNGASIYRCQRTSAEFDMGDWIPYNEFTDSMAITNAVKVLNDFKIDVLTNYVTSALMYTTICSFNLMAHGASVPMGENNKIWTEQPVPPYYVGDIYYYDTKIYTCKNTKEEGDFDFEDWELTDYPTTSAKIIGTINGGESEIQIDADKVSLAGKNISMTSDNITISSTNFNVDKDGNIKANNGEFTGKITSSNATITGGSLALTSVSENNKLTITDSVNPNCILGMSARAIKWSGNQGGYYQLLNVSSAGPQMYMSATLNGVLYETSYSPLYITVPVVNITNGGSISGTNGGLTIDNGGNGSAGSNSVWIGASNNVTLNPSGGAYVRIGSKSSYLISTAGGQISSRILKENIKDFEDYDDAIKVLNNIKLYNYDYKYNVKDTEEDNKNNFGFIIDEVEEIDKADKFFKFTETKAIVTDDKCLDELGASENPDDENIITYKRYDNETLVKYLLTVCKAQQQQIDSLEDRLTLLEEKAKKGE